jgi:coenzyme PQQ synthesis protein D (PqqD)
MSGEPSELARFPLSRSDVDINEVDDGLVIFDATHDRVHYLNQTASVVFALCTGEQDEASIALQVQATFGLAEVPARETRESLHLLQAEGLLV